MTTRLTCFWEWGWVEGGDLWWVGSFWSFRWHWRSPWGPRGYFPTPQGTLLPGTHTAPPPNVPSVAPVNRKGEVIILLPNNQDLHFSVHVQWISMWTVQFSHWLQNNFCPPKIMTCILMYMYSKLISNQHVNYTIFTFNHRMIFVFLLAGQNINILASI